MLSKLKNKIKLFRRQRKIAHNQKYWIYHQKGIREAKKYHFSGYLDFFTFERNYRLIKNFSRTIK